jgi:transcriptional regulator with XRE-family HTH domain
VSKQTAQRVLRDLGRRVAEIRVTAGMTQEQFAERRLKVSPKYLQRIEAGRANLTVTSLVTLADALSVDVRELFRAPKSRDMRRGRPRKVVG